MLKKSNGEIYELRKPNPLMMQQEEWSNDVILHNMNFEEKSYIAKNIKIKEVKLQELSKNEPIEYIENIPEVTVEKVEEESEREQNIFEPTNKLVCWVLPAEIKTTKDTLYGDTIRRVVYGNKFTMEMEKISQEDFTLDFWTNAKPLEKSSIIYIPEDRQWWKVASCIDQENGFLVKTITSDQTPSFT